MAPGFSGRRQRQELEPIIKALHWPRNAANRKILPTTSVSLLATLFHFLVARPQAEACATAPKGWAHLHHVFDHPEARVAAPASPSGVTGAPQSSGAAAATQGEGITRSAPQPAPSGATATQGPPPTVADPALLYLLQQALRERRDAEYIYRLRNFKRRLSPILCPPLPSYSLQGIELSDQERAVATCHEQRQLQAQCVFPTDLSKPMRCPKGYQWRLEDDRIESARRWLADRAARKKN